MGVAELRGSEGDGPTTVFYPTKAAASPVTRGAFTLELAANAEPVAGNRRLVIISPGSGGSPWTYTDLARALVDAGFVVGMPEHRGDNHRDSSQAGPQSWKRRPAEVSSAIDTIARDPRFAAVIDFGKVGMYGMSAGGHTALTLAGSRWSPRAIKRHCDAHIAEDFHSCVGLATRLRGNFTDGIKQTVALWIIAGRVRDASWYGHHDPRIAAVVAGVPYAADFDMDSLARPRVPLALVTVGQDKWLVPRFHSERVRAACHDCPVLAHMEQGGHGALLSPFPPNVSGLLAELLADAPGFDRKQLPEVDRRIAAFFRRHLLSGEGNMVPAGPPIEVQSGASTR